MRMTEQQMREYEPERPREMSWSLTMKLVVLATLLGFVFTLILVCLPTLREAGPLLGHVATGVIIFVMIVSPLMAVAWLFNEARIRELNSRKFSSNKWNVFPRLLNKQQDGFITPEDGELPHPEPPQHYAPTISEQNAGVLIKLVEQLLRQHMQTMMTVNQEEPPVLDVPALPSYVEYDQVRHLIPPGHALVGVGSVGVETKEDYIRALLWIVGGSGSGKTNSTVIRIDDDARRGHQFLGVDPHAAKPDSLTNALLGYTHLFRRPLAQSPEDIESVLDDFLAEFYGRRDQGWPLEPPITLAVDEVGSLTMDLDRDDKQAVRMADKLKRIARICGQESRDFNMFGIYISQNAAGLAWLRRYAVMVLAHQVVQFEERMRVCNQDREMARSMDNWPKGRTYVYGIAFEDGPLLVQQPVVKTRVVDAAIRMPDLPPKTDRKLSEDPARLHQEAKSLSEDTQEAAGRETDEIFSGAWELKTILKEAGRRRDNGESIDSILKKLGLSPGGRNNQNLKMLLDGMATQE